MNEQVIQNIQNPFPILQQPKSEITTNPFISNEQKIIEIEEIQKEANKIIEDVYKENKISGLKYTTFSDINSRISDSIIGILNDLFEKPNDVSFFEYIQTIFLKEQRYAYIGVFLIFIALIISILRNISK
jgi:hypothetical protein